jgi:protein O-GlcNAc transferase
MAANTGPGGTMTLQQLYNQAEAAQKSGNLVEAERLYRDIIAASPAPEAIVNYATVLARLGRNAAALASFERALSLAPTLIPGLFNRGNLLLEMKLPAEALESYDRILALRQDIVGVWNNRGTALRALRRLDAALASYERAAALAPDHLNALTNIAIARMDMGQPAAALAAADRALSVRGDFAEALYVRANALTDLERPQEALGSYEQALAANPAHPHALNGAARAALALCDWPRTAVLGPRLRSEILAGSAVIQPFTLMGYSDDAALQYRCAQNAIRRAAPPRKPLWTGARYNHDRIRIAYLSADFHQHATAALMAELFERHDRARFEVTAIAFGPDDGSAMRTRLKQAFDRFEDVRAMSDFDVAKLLHGMEVDIAVDLNGHTQDARPGIFAWRPAPVQVNYLVYPGTTGADYMTHILADRIVLPADQQAFFSEKIVHLPDCYQANDATRPVDAAPTRADAGLPEGGFVFCCFNGNWKITAAMFDIWMRLLTLVPQSLLWLMDSPAANNLRAEATARGVDAARLVFAPKLAAQQHLARHALADLFLDTLPYNAHTTASDALWAGLPVLTCYGGSFAGRVAASLLKAVEMPELVTTGLAAYEEQALELARNPALLRATREKLERNKKRAPLYDSARFVANIEAAFAAMLND